MEHQEGNAFDVWTIGKILIFYFTLSMQTVLEGHFRNTYVCMCVCVCVCVCRAHAIV